MFGKFGKRRKLQAVQNDITAALRRLLRNDIDLVHYSPIVIGSSRVAVSYAGYLNPMGSGQVAKIVVWGNSIEVLNMLRANLPDVIDERFNVSQVHLTPGRNRGWEFVISKI